jgi:putative transposase
MSITPFQYGVPCSTARGWLAISAAQVATLEVLNWDMLQLQQEVLWLRTRIQELIALLRVLLVVLKISRFTR